MDAAEGAFQRTLELAPDYADARIGLARVAQRRGNAVEALAALGPIAPGNAEADELRGSLQLPLSAGGHRLDVDLTHSELERLQPDWWEGAVQLRYQASPATAFTGRLETARRFGRNDVFGEVRLDQQLSDGANGYISLGVTPSPDFKPGWQLGIGGSVRVNGGTTPTILTFDGRQAHYRSGDIQTVSVGVEQYVADGRAWLTARSINIFDEDGDHFAGWQARGDVMATRRLRLFTGIADAPDTSEGSVVETFSIFGGAAYEISNSHDVRVSLAHEDRESGSARFQLSIGLGVRF